MLLPESMSRVVIVGAKTQMDEAIDAVYSIGAVHLVDHTVGDDEGFSIGAPLEQSSKASERLLKIRAAGKELGVDMKKMFYHPEPKPVGEIQEKIKDSKVEAFEKKVFGIVDERNTTQQKVAALKSDLEALERLSPFPVPLELYSGYDSLTVYVGTVKDNPESALKAVGNTECLVDMPKKASRGTVVAFVPNEERDAASAVLTEHGFVEMAIPEITGTPADAIPGVSAKIVEAEARIEELNLELEELSKKYATTVAAIDEELSIMVDKGETPLRIAVSDYSFVMDGWIPEAQVDAVAAALDAKFNGTVHMAVQETRGRKMEESEKAEKRFEVPPTKAKNGPLGKRFEYPTSLVSTPKYQEIDPSSIIAIFYPFFFGFMVGDVGYAIPFIILGAYGMKVAKSRDFQAIATVLFFGGLWAAIFGFFFFAEMLGMHFAGPTSETSTTWEALLGITLPEWFTGIFPSFVEHGETYIGISKLHSTVFMLKLTVYIGIVHLAVSYAFGFINVLKQHNFMHAMHEKGGWLISLFGVVFFCYGLSQALFGETMKFEGIAVDTMLIGAVLMLIGIAFSWKVEGAHSIMGQLSLVGNVLSYTRLAAIGMSKAGMALAFNYMSIIMIGPNGIIGIVLGFLVFLIGHLMIWILAIISAGLHGLRLQYVEMMAKFFVGGGTEYEPLAVKRVHTEALDTEV